MDVLLVTAAFPPMTLAGEADHAYYLCRHLAEKGCRVSVLTSRGALADGLDGVAVYPCMQRWSWREVPRLLRCARRVSPQVVLLFYSGGPLYHDHAMITFAPTLVKAVLPRAAFVTQFENHFSPPVRGLAQRVGRRLLRRWVDPFGTLLRQSDRIILLSHRQGHALARWFPAVLQKSAVIPPPPLIPVLPDPDGAVRRRGREALGVRPGEWLLAYFGLIYPGKGIETLLRAFCIVRDRLPQVRLVLIGGIGGGERGARYGESLRRLAGELALAPWLCWTGAYASGSVEASRYLRAADLCVLPVDRGLALNNSSLAAAVAHGLPVVATRGEEVEAPLRHGDNVYLCQARDPEALAQAVLTVLAQPALQQRLRAGARELARRCFSWETAINRTLELFSQCNHGR